MADLKRLEITYPESANYVFEDLCTHLFCTELGLRESVNRRANQRAIESDPVRKDGKVYGYQAKYYQAGTDLRKKKNEFIKSVEGARRVGVTNLKIYVNQSETEDPRTQEDPAWMKEVREAARDVDGEPEVQLDWWFLSRIEDTLDMPRYRYIRDLYFSGNAGETSPSAYYDHVCDIFANEPGSELFGETPLRDSYIEPTVNVKTLGIRGGSVREFVESWVESDGSIAVICGEPGHGKTALCQKAMYDFYEDDWLSGKVSNVLRFSLNPANTDALANDQFYLYSLLSWGDDRRSPEQRVSKQACTNALVFFDGFDELLEWHPRFDLERFIKDYILKFQEGTRAHVIITSRNMVVEPNKTEYTFGHPRVPIARLQPIPKEQQLAWIHRYIDWHQCHPTHGLEKNEQDLNDYLVRYRQLGGDSELEHLLGIPIIFRMIVVARYLPGEGQTVTQIYDNLFEVTWERHRHREGDATVDSSSEDKVKLSRHALDIFCDNDDTAPVQGILDAPWLFSFYTTHANSDERRVGFLHRSFYQYFLAHEILSWFRGYASDCNEECFRKYLSLLACRRIDNTTLGYICSLYPNLDKSEALEKSFSKAYAILKETDGILQLPLDKANVVAIKDVTPLEGANNVFWNVVSICSITGHVLSADKVNARTLRLYDLSGCYIRGVNLKQADLMGANLREAHLERAHLGRADLGRADLFGACLEQAHLERADLERADLRQADLVEAHLEQARLEQARLEQAHLERAHLVGAHLGQAYLEFANLRGADLGQADLEQAHLERAHLVGADLTAANLLGADLREVSLERAYLECADLRGVDLFEAHLERAHLEGADLRGANLGGAYYFEEDLAKAITDETDF